MTQSRVKGVSMRIAVSESICLVTGGVTSWPRRLPSDDDGFCNCVDARSTSRPAKNRPRPRPWRRAPKGDHHRVGSTSHDLDLMPIVTSSRARAKNGRCVTGVESNHEVDDPVVFRARSCPDVFVVATK